VVLRLAAHLAASAAAVPWQARRDGRIGRRLGRRGASVVAIAWMANLFKLHGRRRRLAGGMAAIGFAALAAAAHRAGAPDLAAFAAALAAASLAFLAFNFPPARVFMGMPVPCRSASSPARSAGRRGARPVARVVPGAGLLAVHRRRHRDARPARPRGEAVWKAHRGHYYQRLVLGGWSHRRLALAAWRSWRARRPARWPPVNRPGCCKAYTRRVGAGYCAIAIAIDRRHPRNPG